jgi:magnesium transporter
LIRLLTKPDGGTLSLVEGLLPARLALEAAVPEKPRLWFDLTAPTRDEVDLFQGFLKFAPDSWEDALSQDHPPKVEEVGAEGDRPAYLFVVARAPGVNGEAESEVVALFMRSRLLLTVHPRQSRRIDAAMERVLRDPKQTISYGIELVAHAVLDEFVESYGPAIDKFEEVIEGLEERVAKHDASCGLESILGSRRTVTRLYREARPMRDVMASLAREGHPLIKPKARVAFRDLYDHIQRCLDRLEGDRELIASLRDAFLALQNNRMNEVMRALTVLTAISGAISVVTGVFGMNFRFPGADDAVGFWITLVALLSLGAGIFALFRFKRWV